MEGVPREGDAALLPSLSHTFRVQQYAVAQGNFICCFLLTDLWLCWFKPAGNDGKAFLSAFLSDEMSAYSCPKCMYLVSTCHWLSKWPQACQPTSVGQCCVQVNERLRLSQVKEENLEYVFLYLLQVNKVIITDSIVKDCAVKVSYVMAALNITEVIHKSGAERF